MGWRERYERSKGWIATLHYMASIAFLIAGLVALFGVFGVEATHGDAALLLVFGLLGKEGGERWQREFEEYVESIKGRR